MDEEYEMAKNKIEKYLAMLTKQEKIGHALRRLDNIKMTLELLSDTGIGKAVNQLRNHDEYGEDAQRIVEKWKSLARSHGLKPRKRSRSSSVSLSGDDDSASSKSSPRKKIKRKKDDDEKQSHVKEDKNDHHQDSTDAKKSPSVSKPKEAANDAEDGPGVASNSGISFADILAQGDIVSKPKSSKNKKSKYEVGDWKSSQIDVNYKPSKRLNFEPVPTTKDPSAGARVAAVDVNMFKPRKDTRRVYAGRPKGYTGGEVPTLMTICTRVLAANIEAIEETGDIPYYILKPVLEKCNPEQLSHIERLNTYLMDDTDELWEKIVNRAFPQQSADEGETWKDCYARLCVEKDRKLKLLSSKITQHSKEVNAPVRKAILADAKAPRDVRKKQIRYGTGNPARDLPSASEISKARKAIFDRGSKDALTNLPQSVRNATSTLGSHSEKKKAPPKKAALMVKTLKMLKARK